MKVLVTGASGFVGARLATALEEHGHEVLAMTRSPDKYEGAGTAVYGDISEPESLAPALEGAEAAYYLVHSLASQDFRKRDRDGAYAFGQAAAAAGVAQVIYLGGLGDDGDDLSEHLRSRREVEKILRHEVPTTVLRAGIVIGDGGISWEILRQLVQRLPVMVTPRWVQTKTQPVSIDDALVYLEGVLGRPEAENQTYEIGGSDVLTYRDMLLQVASITEKKRLIMPVPLLSPGLSSHWLRLITDVDLPTAKALVESLTNEVVVHDRAVVEMTGHEPMSFREAAQAALRARSQRLG